MPKSEYGRDEAVDCGCCLCTQTGQVAIVESCGKFDYIATPGFHCVNIFCCQCYAGTVSLRLSQMNVSVETKTKDNVFVIIKVSVQYEVLPDKVEDFFYRLASPKQQMEAYVFDVVRSSVPNIKLDDVFTTKDEISNKIKEELEEAMSQFGMRIVSTPITDIDPAPEVKRAMNAINVQDRLRVAAQFEAEGNKVKQVKAAEANAEETIIQAQAEADAKYQQGLGISRQRQAIMNGLRESVMTFSESITDVDNKAVMEMMMMTQYFDTLRDIGTSHNSHTVFTEHQPGAVSDLAAQIRNGFLQSKAPQPASMQR